MKITKEVVGNIVCIKNATGLVTTARVLEFHKGPRFTDVDAELPDGTIINTFEDNLTESSVMDVVKHGIAAVIFKAA